MDEGFKKLAETERSLDNRELIRRVKSGQREGQIHGRKVRGIQVNTTETT